MITDLGCTSEACDPRACGRESPYIYIYAAVCGLIKSMAKESRAGCRDEQGPARFVSTAAVYFAAGKFRPLFAALAATVGTLYWKFPPPPPSDDHHII